MPLDTDSWNQAEEKADLISILYGIFKRQSPVAYSIDEILEIASSSVQEDDSGTLEGFGALFSQQTDNTRYEIAAEILVREGKVEKRTAVINGEIVTYYRAIA